MNRLKFINNLVNSKNKKYFKNIIYPNIEKETNDIYIISKSTDRLDLLAKKYYSDDSLYWVIARCNGIYGSLYLNTGEQICIPNKSRLDSIINEFVELNKI